MISLHYTVTKEDYGSFYTFVMWGASDRKKQRIKNILKQTGFVLVFLLVYYFAGGFTYINNTTIIIILLMFATSFIPLFGSKANIDKQIEEITEDIDNNSLFEETFLSASDTGLNIKTTAVDVKYEWIAIIKKNESPDYYFLFVNAMQAIIIPKRAFKNNEEKTAFDKILSRNLSFEAELKEDILHAGK